MRARVISDEDRLDGDQVRLRLVTLADCTERYREWLADPQVNQFLETRWREQTLESIRQFVETMRASPDDYLFAIIERATGTHVGNIKLGPINWHHLYADVSYFVGDRQRWGRGLATEAIRLVTDFGFQRLGLHRLQAGLYASNTGSARALEKAGYRFEAALSHQLRTALGWQDHLWYRMLASEWTGLQVSRGTS